MGCAISEQTIQQASLPVKDQYERKQLIGVGHHGRVYRAVYCKNKNQYAVKVVDQFCQDLPWDSIQAKYAQIIKNISQLRHQKLVVYEYVQFRRKQLAVVMDLAKEGTLKKYIQKNGKLTQQSASHMIAQILDGLKYLHKNGINHKDLKSSNILIFLNQQLKLSDYGLAELYDARLIDKTKLQDCKTIQYTRGDSLPYMAPQVIKKGKFTEKSDVWSVGCIALEMLTGKAPWNSLANTFQQAFKIISEAPLSVLPTDLTSQCRSFLEASLSLQPSNRQTVSSLLLHPFIRNTRNQLYFEESSVEKELVLAEKQSFSQKNLNTQIKKDVNNTIIEQSVPSSPCHQQKNKSQNSHIALSRKFTHRKNKTKDSINKNTTHNQQRNLKLFRLQEIVNNSLLKPDYSQIESINNKNILPQIEQDEQDTIMLNNKKVKRKQIYQNRYQIKTRVKTQEPQWSEPQQSYRYNQNYDFFKSKTNRVLSNQNQSNLSSFDKGLMQQDSFQMESQQVLNKNGQSNCEYFKRPLKLLKKKLQQTRNVNSITTSSNYNTSTISFKTQHEKQTNVNKRIDTEQNQIIQVKKIGLKQSKVQPIEIQDKTQIQLKNYRIRAMTEPRRDDRIIDTELSRAERDRYISGQVMMQRQRQQEKQRWQNQLQKEAQIIKKQFSHRYAFPGYHSIPI